MRKKFYLQGYVNLFEVKFMLPGEIPFKIVT